MPLLRPLAASCIVLLVCFVLQTEASADDIKTTRTILVAGSKREPAGTGGRSTKISSEQIRLRLVKVYDREGFGQPVEAFRLLLPAEWKTDGWIRWVARNINCPANIIEVGLKSSAADGLTGFEIFSPFTWQWTDDPMMQQTLTMTQRQNPAMAGCPLARPMGAAEYLQNRIVPQRRAGSHVTKTEALPQVAKPQETKLQTILGPALQAGLVAGVKVDGARIHVTRSANKHPVEEWLATTISVIAQKGFSATAAYNGQMGHAMSYVISAEATTAGWAAQGQLDANAQLFATIIGSIRPNQAWVNAVSQTQTAMANAQIKGAADRSRIWTQASRDISNIYSQSYQQQQAVQDGLARQFDEHIKGVETYVDPNTKERVELTAGYRQYWTNGRNEYILSNDANFNPAVELHEDWRLMEHPAK